MCECVGVSVCYFNEHYYILYVHDPPTLNLQCLLQGTDMYILPFNQEVVQGKKLY